MNERYKKQVALLIRIMPSVYKIEDFAVHCGTAINLFIRDMPRYSVDIDLTYLPIKNREESFKEISMHLSLLKQQIERTIPGITVVHRINVLKLFCTYKEATVIIEVNGIKRGVIGKVQEIALSLKAQQEFSMSCTARIVPFSILYGGKIAAALGRQHPRDLFDYKHMEINSFDEVKEGLLFYLLSSDKPILESLQPNPIDQNQALEKQFTGMTDTKFDYKDYKLAREKLIDEVNKNLTEIDKEFILSFESGEPDWDKCIVGDLSEFPAIKWKLQNINILKIKNRAKYDKGVENLRVFLIIYNWTFQYTCIV